MSNQAWVTLATNDSYGLGALVLANSLRRVASSYPAVVLITPSVTEPMRERLRAVFAEVIIVDVLDSGDAAHLALLQRPELGITFTKIHCWNLTQYQKCVFLDADTLIVQNCDELFEREQLSAAPDVGWPDCFNSGVFVFTPSADTFNQLIAFAQERGSFDGGDQGLLNSFFSDWSRGDINKHLPFLYNVTSTAFYSYLPALKQFGQDLKIIHFIGAAKPWLQQYNFESGTIDAPDHIREFLQLWWDIFVSQVHCQLDTGMVEVEEVPPEVPAIPPLDVSHEYHYQPIMDPQSEFTWHHPNTQKTEESQEKQIDIREFFDPWHIYRGHIPANVNIEASHNSELGRMDNHEEIRNYGWDYQAQKHSQRHVTLPHNIDQIWQQHHTPHSDNRWQHNTQQVQTDHWQHQEYSHQNPAFNSEDHWQNQTQHHNNQTQNYDHIWQHNSQLHSNQTHYSEHSNQTYHNDQMHHSNWTHHSEQPHYTNNHNAWQENSVTQSVHSDFHSNNNSQNESQNNFNRTDNIWQQQHHSTKHEDHTNHNQFKQHDNEHHIQHSSDHHEDNYGHNEYHSYDHSNHTPYHDNSNYTYHNKSNYLDDNTQNSNQIEHSHKDHTITENISSVHFVQVENVKKRNRRKRRPHPIDLGGRKDLIINGDVSESESDDYEEIIPRHPYDGFYLRHRATIDSRGRKICLHEIPPTPSPPPDSPLPDDNVDEEEEYFSAGCDCESGVAGNLARVLPGNPGQREALDELTRRQGWEAGNIDYMGADSFDNIWAKISQTLSKPRPSPPKQQSPPKDIIPTQPAPKQAEVVEQVEVAKEAELVESAVPSEILSAPIQICPVAPETAPEPVQICPVAPEEAPSVQKETAPAPVQICPVAPEIAKPAQEEIAPAPVQICPVASEKATPAQEEIAPAPVQICPVAPEIAKPGQEETAPAPVQICPVAPEKAPLVQEETAPATVQICPVAPEKAPSDQEEVAPVPVQICPVAPEIAKPAQEEIAPAPVQICPVAPEKATPAQEEIAPAPVQICPVAPEIAKPGQEETAPAPVQICPVAPEIASPAQEEIAPAPVQICPVAPEKTTPPQEEIAPAPVQICPVAPEKASPGEEKIAPVQICPVAPDNVTPVPEEIAPVQICPVVKPTEAAPITIETASAPELPAENIPVTVEATDAEIQASVQTKATEASAVSEGAVVKVPEPAIEASTESSESVSVSPGIVVEAAAAVVAPSSTPEKSTLDSTAGLEDSPPLVNTPTKEQEPIVVAVKSEERRKPAGKLKLVPPAAADPLPTPDSELEDAAALAQSIIASELRTPTVTSPEPAAAPTSPLSPPLAPALTESLPIEEPEVPTPPVGAVSLAQIGVKSPTKGKSTTAAQIASSVVETPSEAAPVPVTSSPVAETATPAPAEAPKKKIVKKVVKKEAGASGADAPVPPPRKKEKKPKEK